MESSSKYLERLYQSHRIKKKSLSNNFHRFSLSSSFPRFQHVFLPKRRFIKRERSKPVGDRQIDHKHVIITVFYLSVHIFASSSAFSLPPFNITRASTRMRESKNESIKICLFLVLISLAQCHGRFHPAIKFYVHSMPVDRVKTHRTESNTRNSRS